MDVLYIFGITILLINGVQSAEEAKPDKDPRQRILLRKLQNFQETPPAPWNEVLADALVNKIKILSFTSQEKEITTNDTQVTHQNIWTDFFSKALVVYKKFIYDSFVGKRKTSDELENLATPASDNVEVIPKKVPEEVVTPTLVTFAQGPKSEVELLEPRYHGKITLEETTENPGQIANPNQRDTSNVDASANPEVQNVGPQVQASVDPINPDQNSVNPVKEDSSECPEGFVKSENGDCVTISRLILAVPNQCPIGYKKDWLGYCRKMFHF